MQTGVVRHFPLDGNVMAQNDLMMEGMRAAWYVWYINAYKPTHRIPITPEDSQFMENLIPPDYILSSKYTAVAVKELAERVNG